jgi:ABC-type uncharacterized transport system involved in gliding motility auxiliary subunit
MPLVLHVVLLLLVLGQIVYLASRYRVRIDMTTDKLWTTTASTSKLVGNLEERLIVEAYFSPKENLPLSMTSTRDWADNFLDEITQLGKGRVIVQRFDPNSDAAIAKAASRLGIKPLNLRSQSATSLSLDQHWQGLRLLYDGGKQKVIEQFLPGSSFQAEAAVTPKIKEVITGSKRRIGYMEWPARVPRGRQQAVMGWNTVRNHPGLKSRYEFQNFKDEDGALLPKDLDALFLFRPMLLTDRQKYVIDQFVMTGGTLVIFADAVEYEIDPQRRFKKVPFSLDAKASTYSLVQQLDHYGVDWQPRLVADMHKMAYTSRVSLQEYFSVALRGAAGRAQMAPVQYPYFFNAVNVDWAESADQLAVDATNKIDERLAAQYRKTLVPGMPADDFLFRSFKKIGNRGPGFYWPTWVGLRERAGGVPDLPEGVDGRVLMWSSPIALIEDPPSSLNPIGLSEANMNQAQEQFFQGLKQRVLAEPRTQVPLMVEVTGEFSSFFAGKKVPKRPSQIDEDEPKEEGPKEKGEKPSEEAPADPNGPQPAKPGGSSNSHAEDPMATQASSPGRIVVVGDATFLRDDLINGDYGRIGGPSSGAMAMPFFAQMLDWLSDDRDLVELQSRVPADRTLTLVEPSADSQEDARDAEQALRSKTNSLVVVNVALPCVLLLVFGLIVWRIRRNQKHAFLASLDAA